MPGCAAPSPIRTVGAQYRPNFLRKCVDPRDSGRAGQIIGCELDGQSVTLEPGGQFELSGAPVRTLPQTCQEVGSHLFQVSQTPRPPPPGPPTHWGAS